MNLIKNLILRLPFVIKAFEFYRDEAIANALGEERPKIFSLAQKDILETMADDLEKQAKILADEKLKTLLSIVDEKLVVTLDVKTGAVFIGGKRADIARLSNLKAEAELLEKMDLWNILNQTVKELANKAMFVSGDSLDDLKKGRSVLYTLDSQKRIVETFKAVVPK